MLRYGVDYEHEFSRVFSGWIGAEHRRIYGNEQVPLLLRDQTRLDHVDATQMHVMARFAWDEHIHRGPFTKTHIFTKYPVLAIDLTGGATSSDAAGDAGRFQRDQRPGRKDLGQGPLYVPETA